LLECAQDLRGGISQHSLYRFAEMSGRRKAIHRRQGMINRAEAELPVANCHSHSRTLKERG